MKDVLEVKFDNHRFDVDLFHHLRVLNEELSASLDGSANDGNELSIRFHHRDVCIARVIEQRAEEQDGVAVMDFSKCERSSVESSDAQVLMQKVCDERNRISRSFSWIQTIFGHLQSLMGQHALLLQRQQASQQVELFLASVRFGPVVIKNCRLVRLRHDRPELLQPTAEAQSFQERRHLRVLLLHHLKLLLAELVRAQLRAEHFWNLENLISR